MGALIYSSMISGVLILSACGTSESGGENKTGDSEKNPSTVALPDSEAEIASVGPKGDKGERGEKGDKGEKGDAAPTPIPNQWQDVFTGKTWHIGGTATYIMVNFTPPCAMPYRLPTTAEGEIAALHGLGDASAAISGPVDFWTSDAPSAAGFNWTVRFATSQGVEVASTQSHGVFCVK